MDTIHIKRIYHHYLRWEDYNFGFYDNCSGKIKEEKLKSAISLFNDSEKTKEYMFRVVNEWKMSCEHNLTNESLNKITYIGQAACALYDNIPSTVTMEAWNLIDCEVQKKANKSANEAIKHWYKSNIFIQLCLNID